MPTHPSTKEPVPGTRSLSGEVCACLEAGEGVSGASGPPMTAEGLSLASFARRSVLGGSLPFRHRNSILTTLIQPRADSPAQQPLSGSSDTPTTPHPQTLPSHPHTPAPLSSLRRDICTDGSLVATPQPPLLARLTSQATSLKSAISRKDILLPAVFVFLWQVSRQGMVSGPGKQTPNTLQP